MHSNIAVIADEIKHDMHPISVRKWRPGFVTNAI